LASQGAFADLLLLFHVESSLLETLDQVAILFVLEPGIDALPVICPISGILMISSALAAMILSICPKC